ncbi:actin depolymerizing protein [Cystobasidium minutum MCA 4210]|uniref:actin depolymerizing protein n=1 Tax=Cystobasidium minutum MCA 4210 TaxID=1397322 RepID=UPI0034CD8807|eukprot:jgi/Rhomi1/194002/gm1.2216_g
MADVSDPEIKQAYEDVRSKSASTWLVLKYDEGKKDKVVLAATGEGDPFESIKPLLQPDQVNFAYAKIVYAVDKESTREKFVLFTYIGPEVKIMRRAKISVQKADVTQVLRTYSIEVPLESADQLQEEAVINKLKSVGGANYGPGT